MPSKYSRRSLSPSPVHPPRQQARTAELTGWLNEITRLVAYLGTQGITVTLTSLNADIGLYAVEVSEPYTKYSNNRVGLSHIVDQLRSITLECLQGEQAS